MKDFFVSRESRHNIVYQVVMMVFIISLGMGDVIRIFGVNISHITTALVLVMSILDKRLSFNGLRNKYYKRIVLFGIVWCIYPFITLLWVRDMEMWQFYYRGLLINFVIVWLIIRYIECKEDWEHLVKSCVLLLIMSLCIGLFEIITDIHVLSEYHGYPRSPVTFYYNINDTASVFFTLFFIFLIYYLQTKKERYQKRIFIIVAAITLFELLVLTSRAVILCYGVMAVFGFVYYHLWTIEKPKARKIVISGMISLLVLLVVLFLIKPPTFYFGLFSGNPDYYKSGDYSGDMHRIRLIEHSFREWIDIFCVGLGPGQSRAVEDYPLHNFYLEMLFDYGILIAGGFFVSFFAFGCNNHRLKARLADAIINSSFFVFMLLGVASSKFFLIRMTWVVITLLYCLEYGEYDERLNEVKM